MMFECPKEGFDERLFMADTCQMRTPVTTQSQLRATRDMEVHELPFVVRAGPKFTIFEWPYG
ncbi:hypothetical protein WK77_12290 [Burkholderia ubonensis]|nr:hypothetical protein WJ67_01125 [Burkholderia ubonensis]KVV10213.1 hypothetical protein WK77_12290 [Burkholderia ubonensis]